MRKACWLGSMILFAGSVWAQSNIWQGGVSADWFDPANWSLGAVPDNGTAVAIPASATRPPVLTNTTAALAAFSLASGQVLTVEGWSSALIAEEMTLGGTIRHASNTVTATNALGEWIPNQRIWLKGSNILLQATGRLDGDYRGYPRFAGPGCPIFPVDAQGGPSHAGPGRRGQTGYLVMPAYGDPAAPWQPGSGGSNTVSGEGGGSIRIEAAGQVTIHGSILARGRNGYGTYGQTGGSGGSIWITCRTLAGSTNGWLAVDGGSGNQAGAGASAGRMAVHYDPEAQAALAEPCPPIRFSGRPGPRGTLSEWLEPAMGTLYFPDLTMLEGPFTGKRLIYTKLVIPGFTNWNRTSLALDDCIIGLPEGMRIDVQGDFVLTNGAALHLFAAEVADPVADEGAWLGVGGNAYIGTNCWVHPYASPTNGGVPAFAVTGDLVVARTGGFDADYKGYTFWRGPGSIPSIGGAGYGGAGSIGFGGSFAGPCYGNPEGPVLAGSGGCTNNTYAKGVGQGGGAIRLDVGGRAVIDGTLTANGSDGFVTHGAAGSGGGIGLRCRTLDGSTSGLIRVNGGYGNYYGGSGGGGRIAVAYDPAAQAALPDPRPPVRFSAYAWPRSTQIVYNQPAEMGTLSLPDTTLLMSSPTAAADWRGQFWHVRPVISGFTNWAPASLAVSNCVVRFPDGFALAPAGNLVLYPNSELHVHAAPTNGADRYGARVAVGGNLALATNAWLVVQAHRTNGAVVLVRVEGDARIDAGGGINADWRGYNPVPGNTNGPGPGRNSTSGGGYGGKGGNTMGGYTNGLAILPLGPGSPGGWYTWGAGVTSGSGGGSIRLLVGGLLTLNGTLTADGAFGIYYGGSGGSGGAVFVTARRMQGSGLLKARGGDASNTSVYSSGGGGRVAVWWRITPDEAEAMMLSLSMARLHANEVPPGFTGTTDVLPGPIAPATMIGEPGTAGFYRFGYAGTVLLIR